MVEIWRILIPLLLAHLATDFFLQSRNMVEQKQKERYIGWYLLFHSIIAGGTAYVFTAYWSAFEILWVTFLSHFLIDAWKGSRKNPEKLYLFWVDQLLHILVILGLVLWMAGIDQVKSLFAEFPLKDTGILIMGILFVLHPCSVIIQKVMGKWQLSSSSSTKTEKQDLERAGHVIGLLERVLIFVFIIINQFAAIGLLIAAKSILRFGSVKDKERKESEYILVGTLLSFTLATLTGLIVTIFI